MDAVGPLQFGRHISIADPLGAGIESPCVWLMNGRCGEEAGFTISGNVSRNRNCLSSLDKQMKTIIE
jgi:hypothetical protein